MLVYVHDIIVTFLMEQVIAVDGKFYADEIVWANIVHGE
jgi:hypothetical protein